MKEQPTGNMGLVKSRPGELWLYSCLLGLRYPVTCSRYQLDPRSRGALAWDGCPSCIHGQPGNERVAQADAAHSLMMAHEQWTREWPKTPGHYWFYGWRFTPLDKDELPEICFAEVIEAINGFMYTARGTFLFRRDGARGLWKPAVLPEPPDEELTYDRV